MPHEFPAISRELLDALNEIFPDSLPKALTYTDRDIAVAVGTRFVINRLQLEYDRQNKLGRYAPGGQILPSHLVIPSATGRFLGR